MSESKKGKLLFRLVVKGRMPSWNAILGMHPWARKKWKDNLAKDFLSALKALERSSLMKTTSVENTIAIFAATHLEDYLEMNLQRRKLRQANAKLKKAKKKKP